MESPWLMRCYYCGVAITPPEYQGEVPGVARGQRVEVTFQAGGVGPGRVEYVFVLCPLCHHMPRTSGWGAPSSRKDMRTMPTHTTAAPPHNALPVPAAFYADDSPPIPPPDDPHRREWDQPQRSAHGFLPRWRWLAVATGIVMYWGVLFVLVFLVH